MLCLLPLLRLAVSMVLPRLALGAAGGWSVGRQYRVLLPTRIATCWPPGEYC